MKRQLLPAGLLLAAACTQPAGFGPAVRQVSIPRVEQMAAFPEPYELLDWRQKALDFDAYAFDFDSHLPAGPVIWLDSARRNIDQVTFGLYTALKDCRQGPDRNGGEFHESLNSLHALMGAGLNGIDKTGQHGHNFVKMVQNYFNTDNGWNIVMNNTCPEVALLGGGYGRDWWYDVFPNVLYYAVCAVFPDVEGAEAIQRTVADQFAAADSVLAGNYDFSYFDYAQMKGCNNWIPCQQDAAGGHAYVLYSAYRHFGDERYLRHAISALEALDRQTESRFYEILLPLGIYTAARLNAEQGSRFDTEKMLGWVFDGCTAGDGRTGWGIMAGKWGGYEVSGLQGSLIDDGGFAFFMNSVDVAWPFVPLVKYEPQYARSIGRWMLNNVNNCRLFFPDQLPDSLQCLPCMQDYTNSIIAYEGLRYEDKLYDVEGHADRHPIALGDGPRWTDCNPPESMFSVYSTSAVGILGAIVSPTDVEGILRLDCNATDFYADKPFPAYLLYNPFDTPQEITWTTEGTRKDLFDIVSRTYLARGVAGQTVVTLPPDASAVIFELPADARIRRDSQGNLTVNHHIIAYEQAH
ncbi:MAG: hypothetical protein IJ721_00155 [Bacteroidales bacterium]|nr:hypothetical protein [Bacteroidales bacterium]